MGPGGAGKTTVGPLLAARIGWAFLDLDAQFMRTEDEISAYIARHGYLGYAQRNVATYLEVRRMTREAAVVAMSSGFLTYSTNSHKHYTAVRQDIECDPLTVLLLPSFELETCVEVTVRRQMGRPYLAGNRAREEQKIRERFPTFAALKCARFCSDITPAQLATEIESFAQSVLSKALLKRGR